MPLRTKTYVAITILFAAAIFAWSFQFPAANWLLFSFLLVLVLLSSGLKIALPRGDSGMSLNFPFIFLAIMRLAPEQALLLGAISMGAQCRIRVKKRMTPIQISFNIASTALASGAALLAFMYVKQHGIAPALALSLASVVYFLFSTVSVALVIASAMGESPYPLWKREFPWYLPFYLVGAALAIVTDMVSNRFGWETALLLIPMVYTVYRSYNAQIIRMRERAQHLEETEALQLRTIEGLSMAIEAKDQNTHEHLFRVRDYVREMGLSLKLGKLEMQALHTAAFLHDIGKLAVPEQIINKPGKLTPEEFEKMKIHPVVGADILERVQFPYPVVPIVRSHHERWDGAGYPDGLKGEEIPLGARILSAADCFDALVSDRPYRKALPVAEALAIIKKMSGTQFDPKIASLLIELHERRVERESASGSSDFSALKTDIDVSRGDAPAAGFEEGSKHPEIAARRRTVDGSGMDATFLYLIGLASEQVHALFETSRALDGMLNLHDLLCLWAAKLRPVLSFDTCAFFQYGQGKLMLRHVDGYDAESFLTEAFTANDGISGWVAENGKPLLNGNAELEGRYRSKLARQEQLKAALSIPLFDLEASLIGVLTLYSIHANSFYRHDLSVLTAISTKTALMIENALERSITIVAAGADHAGDPTQWPGIFRQMAGEIASADQLGDRFTMLVWSLNGPGAYDTKQLRNDSDFMDVLTDMFPHLFASRSLIGRLGENEFVLLIRMPASNAIQEENKIREALHELEERSAHTGSLGTSFFPQDGSTAEELLAVAETRMYRKQRLAERIVCCPAVPLPVARQYEAIAVA